MSESSDQMYITRKACQCLAMSSWKRSKLAGLVDVQYPGPALDVVEKECRAINHGNTEGHVG